MSDTSHPDQASRSLRPVETGRQRRAPLILLLPVILVAMICILPLLYVLMRAHQAGWAEAAKLIFRARVFELLVNTVAITATVTIASATISVAAAWLVERTDLPFRRMWNVLITLPFAVPAFVSGYGWISTFPSIEGFGGAALVLTLSYYPLIYLPVTAALRGMDPALEEVSRSLGHGRLVTFFRVTLPNLRPSLFGGGLLVILHMFAEFGTFAFLNFDTFTTAIFDQYIVAFNGAAAAMLASVLLLLCLAILGLELLLRGIARYATIRKGGPARADLVSLGRAAPIAMIALAALAFFAIGVPFGALTYWLIVGQSIILEPGTVLLTLSTTLLFGVSGSVLAVFIGLLLVIYSVRYGGIGAIMADRLPYVINSIPGLIIGLTFVYFSVRYANPLYQTIPLLLLAYAVLYLPLAQAPIRGVMLQIPPQLEEVAQSMGHGPLAVLRRVTLPLIFPGIGAGFALVCLRIMNELTATLVLRPTGIDTLATMVWEHTTNARYAASAPYAMLLILVSGLPVYLLTMRSAMRGSEGGSW